MVYALFWCEYNLTQPFFNHLAATNVTGFSENLEFSEKILEFREKFLDFSRKILEFREKLLI